MLSTPDLIKRIEARPERPLVSVLGYNFSNRRTIRHREKDTFESASTIKAFFAYQFLKERRSILKNTRGVTKEECGLAGGAGILQHLRGGVSLTWSDLLMLMMTLSDNVATHLIVDELGGVEGVNRYLSEELSCATRLEAQPGSALEDGAHFGTTSVSDLMLLIKKVEEDPEVRDLYHDLWDDQKKGCSTRLARMLDGDLASPRFGGTKGGTFTKWEAHHDIGLVINEKGERLFIAVFTSGVADEQGRARSNPDHAADILIGEIGLAMYKELSL